MKINSIINKKLQGKYLSIGLILIYLFLMLQFNNYLRPDQLFLIFILAAIAISGKLGGKRFITDWAPFTIFIIVYDGMRGIADQIGSQVHVKGPYMMENFFFGWLFNNKPFPFILQWWRESMGQSHIIDFLNIITGAFYTAHFLIPFIFGWLIWHTYNDRRNFYFFAYSITILNILALITFVLYPAAPPWYVWKYHFAIPNVVAFHFGDPSVLINLDKLLSFPLYSSIYGALNPNAFAAIPSLHAAYPFLISYFAWTRWKNVFVRALLVSYVTATWFSACYLNHHYIVDLLIGAIYVIASILLCHYILMPYVLKPLVFKNPESEKSIPDTNNIKQKLSLRTLAFGVAGMILIILLLAHAQGKI